MKLLLDTHILLWFLTDDPKLSKSSLKLIKPKYNQCLVSVATIWEIAIKVGLNKIQLQITIDELIEAIYKSGFDILIIEPKHIIELNKLPMHHRDPFDRMLIAQSNSESIAIVSADRQFSAYDVQLHQNQ